MFAFAEMLVPAAEKAGIRVCDPPQDFEEHKLTHPHWFIFCRLQLGEPMPWPGVHFDNAKVVAGLTVEELKRFTAEDYNQRGFQSGYPVP